MKLISSNDEDNHMEPGIIIKLNRFLVQFLEPEYNVLNARMYQNFKIFKKDHLFK